MVKRTPTPIARNTDKSSSLQASSARTNKKERPSDDLIVTLSDAHENRRARQVQEWESVQPLNVQRAI